MKASEEGGKKMMCNQDMNKFSIPYKYQLRALCEPGSHAGDRPFADLQFVRPLVDTGLSIDCSYGLWMDPQRICSALGLYLLVPKARGQFEELKFKTPSIAVPYNRLPSEKHGCWSYTYPS
jgi:hypothetical protein